MKKRRLKKYVVYVLYAFSFIVVLGTIYLLEIMTSPKTMKQDNTYVNKVILETVLPVVSVKETIIRPYLDESIVLSKKFYDSKANEEEQKNSLIYYDGTYIPNSGADYKKNEVFDVISILSGKVKKISQNQLLGNIVEVEHNNLIVYYQSLGEILVTEGEQLFQGQIIGKSGLANIDINSGNHLHLEIVYNGTNIDPEKCYGLSIDEL